jgi:1-phosphofructokinase family hexose kinase
MILCITPNPAIDRTLMLPALTLGAVLRPRQVRVAAGGKGLNVARAIHTLGGRAVCAGPVGGHSGRLLDDLARSEGLETAWCWTESDTRSCLILVDEAAQQATVINEPGPAQTDVVWAQLGDELVGLARSAACIAVCGSLPQGLSAETHEHLLSRLQASNVPVWVDAHGPGLVSALRVPGLHFKLNTDEAAALLAQPLASADEIVTAGRRLLDQGARRVILTRGGLSTWAIGPDGVIEQPAAPVLVRNPTGSGDSFLAGLLVALERGHPIATALRWAAAAGAANAAGLGGASFTRAAWEAMLGSLGGSQG